MPVQLISPTCERKSSFLAIFDDHQSAGETEWCEKNAEALSDFSAYVHRLKAEARGLGVAGWVPTSHYWLVDGDQVVGTLRVRHYLTPLVHEEAGHIGYDVARSFRQKGYGYEILRLGLLETEKLGIGDVLIHCADSNLASRKIIQRHGGVASGGKGIETWYWIKRKATHPVVRQAYPEDAEAIAKVHVASWQVAYRGIMPDRLLDGLSVTAWTKNWMAGLQSSEQMTFVLELDGAIRGWASTGPCRDEGDQESGELYGIHLDPSCWSKGLGLMLYLRAETALRVPGFVEARVWVLEANQRARRFYEKAGYSRDGRSKRIQLGGAELMEIRYEKDLKK